MTTDWLKLSAPTYCEEGRAAALAYLAGAPTNMDPEGPRGAFEAALARHLDVPASWVIATNSCTGALAAACRLLDNEGRGVEAPVLTWPATYAHAGQAALVDAQPTTEPHPGAQWTAEPGRVRVAVELWGLAVAFPIAQGPRILDAAHAFGAGIEGLRDGEVDAVCYSFGPLKEVPCSRGGALVSPECARPQWRAFVDSGTLGRHGIIPHGFNFQMGEPECVLGVHQLAHAAEWRARRQELLRWYAAYWSEMGIEGGCLLTEPGEASGHLCVARANTPAVREQWRAHLLADHIQCGVHYELPLWAPAVRWPNAWDWSQRVLSLPCHLGVTEADVRRVCENLLL